MAFFRVGLYYKNTKQHQEDKDGSDQADKERDPSFGDHNYNYSMRPIYELMDLRIRRPSAGS